MVCFNLISIITFLNIILVPMPEKMSVLESDNTRLLMNTGTKEKGYIFFNIPKTEVWDLVGKHISIERRKLS